MPGGFGAQSRPRSTSGETIVFPERVTLQAPPEAMHITFDGASPAGEYIPEEDDATAPSDFFALSMDAPVLSAQWDDKHAYTVDNFGLFVAGGLFGLGIGALIDSVKSLIARQPKPTA
jgi:hypothetical protein